MVHHALGRVLVELGAVSEALPHAERAIALGGDTPAAFELLADVLARVGRLDESRAGEAQKEKGSLFTRARETCRRWLR